MKATRESAAVETSAQTGSSARGIRPYDTSVFESAKRTRMGGRRCRSESVADARMAEVGMISRRATEVTVTKRCGPAIQVTVIVKTPAVIEETRAM